MNLTEHQTIIWQSSPGLADWANIQTNLDASGTIELKIQPLGSHQFYRTVTPAFQGIAAR